MKFFGRSSFAASYCLFSLTALSCQMASGLAPKATDGGRDIASAAEEAAPPSAAIVGVAVEADGALLVRLAPKDDRGTFDDDGVRSVRQRAFGTDEPADGALLDEASVSVREHSKVDSDAATVQTMTGKQTAIFICVLLIIIVLAIVLFFRIVGFKEMAPPPKPAPVVVVMPAQPQGTEAKSSASRQSPQSPEPAPQNGEDSDDSENRARKAGQRHASGPSGFAPMPDPLPSPIIVPADSPNSDRDEPPAEEPAGPPRSNAEPAAEAVNDSRNTKRSSRGSEKRGSEKRGSEKSNAMEESVGPPPPEPAALAPAPPAPKEGEVGAEGVTGSDDLNTHLAEGASMGFSTKGKGRGWQGAGTGAPKARE